MWQILTIVVLLGIMIGMQQLSSAVPTGPFDPKSLAATGFIVLAAFTMGELMKRFKLPALLGYILAGIFFGPNLAKLVLGQDATALFDQGVIDDLALINVLTIGVIGTLGGGELKLADIKENGKSLLLFVSLLIFGGIPFMAVLLTIALNVPFDLIGFLKGEPRNSQIAAIMLFAIIEIGMVFMINNQLDNATAQAGRLVRTGQSHAQGMDEDGFKTAVCARILAISGDCDDRLSVDVRILPRFDAPNVPDPIRDGEFHEDSLGFDHGDAGDIVLVRTWYRHPLFTPFLNNALSRLDGGVAVVSATTAFRNEPFS